MGWFDGIFGDSKKTETTSNQSGTQSYGLTPQITNYAGNVASQFTPANFASTASSLGPNQYQTGAASGLQQFLPGVAANAGDLWNMSRTGFTPQDIQSFMSPYTQSVVDATRADFDRSNAVARAQGTAQAAKLGALGGTQGIVNRQLGDYTREKAQAPVIAGLYNQGFQTAGNLAAQNAATKISAAGAGNAATNSAISGYGQLGQLGTGVQQATSQQALVPYQLASQGAQTIAGLAPASGQQTSGNATGTSSTTATPSPFSVGANLVGLGLSAFSDARVKEDIKPIGETFDGQPIYKYRFKGSPKTEIGLMAQDVEQHQPDAVGSYGGIKTVDYDRATKGAEGKADGGAVGLTPFHGGSNDPHSRLMTAFHSIKGMLTRANGGPVLKPYADGGDVGMGSWGATVTPAGPFDNFDSKKFGKGLSEMGSGMGKGQGGDDGPRALADQQAGLSRMLGGMSSARAGFAGGGSTWTSSDETWRSLTPYQRAAAMALMEADGRDPAAARNALGAMINRSMKSGEDLGEHVSRSIYQPAIEPAQRARLRSIVGSDDFGSLTQWAADRAAGKVADPVNGATHFLAPERTMLALEARDPAKYKNWGPRGANWTGYDPTTGEYKGVVLRDSSHAFLAPEGRYEGNPGAPQPPDGMDAATYGSPSGLRPASGSMVASMPAPYSAEAEPSESSFLSGLRAFADQASGKDKPRQAGAPQQGDDTAALRSTESSLAQMLASLSTPRRSFAMGGYADGGAPQPPDGMDAYTYGAPSSAAPPLSRGPIIDVPYKEIGKPYEASPATHSAMSVPTSSRDVIPTEQPSSRSGFSFPQIFKGGVWEGEEMTPMQRAGVAFMSVQSPTMAAPMNGVAANLMAQNNARLEQARVDQALAALMGQMNGQPTLEGRLMPSKQKLLEAQAKKAEMDADKDYQAQLAREKSTFERESALAQKKAEIEQLLELREKMRAGNQPGAATNQTPIPSNQRWRWTPEPTPAPAATQPAPTQQGAAQPTVTPPADGRDAIQKQLAAETAGSPAAIAMARREEQRRRAAEEVAANNQARIEQQKAFDAAVAQSDPLEFARMYQDKGHLLRPDQRAKLEAIMRRLERSN